MKQTLAILLPLLKRGVIGHDDIDRIKKDVAKVAQQLSDVEKREHRVVATRIRETFGKTMESPLLTELCDNPDRVRFIPNSALRQRLRSCEFDVLDFVDTMIEALKRGRYTNYIREADYDKYKKLLELLPKWRSELLDMLSMYGDE